jgi:hypothetical protein
MRLLQAICALLAAVGLAIVVTHSANAQQAANYSAILGDLTVSGTTAPGETLSFGGSGFAANTPVSLHIGSNATGGDVTTSDHSADGSGSVAIAYLIPADLDDGSYTVTVTGVTVDGLTIELAGAFAIDSPQVAAPTPSTPAATPPAPSGSSGPSTTAPGSATGATPTTVAPATPAGGGQDTATDQQDASATGGERSTPAPATDDELAAASGLDDADTAASAEGLAAADADGGATSSTIVWIVVAVVLLGLAAVIMRARPFSRS